VLALPALAVGAAGVSQSRVDRQTAAPFKARIFLTLDQIHVLEAALQFGTDTPEQKKELAALQKDVDEHFDKVLTEPQRKQLKDEFGPRGAPPGAAGPGGPLQAGKILSPSQQDTLKLTPEQRKQLEVIQMGIDAMLEKLLTEEQRKQLHEMQQGPVRVAGPGGPGFVRPPGGAPMFRANRYTPNHPAFLGKALTPGKTVEELQPPQPEKKERGPPFP
jgi:hypothetical protein